MLGCQGACPVKRPSGGVCRRPVYSNKGCGRARSRSSLVAQRRLRHVGKGSLVTFDANLYSVPACKVRPTPTGRSRPRSPSHAALHRPQPRRRDPAGRPGGRLRRPHRRWRALGRPARWRRPVRHYRRQPAYRNPRFRREELGRRFLGQITRALDHSENRRCAVAPDGPNDADGTPVYVAMAVTVEGTRDILGIWTGAHRNAQHIAGGRRLISGSAILLHTVGLHLCAHSTTLRCTKKAQDVLTLHTVHRGGHFAHWRMHVGRSALWTGCSNLTALSHFRDAVGDL